MKFIFRAYCVEILAQILVQIIKNISYNNNNNNNFLYVLHII
jgi:hypothetical protein